MNKIKISLDLNIKERVTKKDFLEGKKYLFDGINGLSETGYVIKQEQKFYYIGKIMGSKDECYPDALSKFVEITDEEEKLYFGR